ncbi:MAG TPA: NADH dehydrogenase ubiquinone Fe-S protein 4 [Hyphomicrobiales bacterium]|nr:NADH dehydrogenase ubiquinone Fe-S protein 4 [Hyphomicrobiales bacterium]
MFARIYRPSKTAMQSGRAKTKAWLMEFDAEIARRVDPLMGWTSAEDMASGQVKLWFETAEEAAAFAKTHGVPYRIEPEHQATARPKAYSDNFAFKRRKPWTH